MDELNKIRLDGGTLVRLYERSLVSLNATNNVAATPALPNVMVVVKAPLTGAQREFLTQILSACKVSPSQVSVINTAEKGVSVEDSVQELAPVYVLSFGAGSGTELFFMENSVGRKFLAAPALDEMMLNTEESKVLKRKTWGELKTMFGL